MERVSNEIKLLYYVVMVIIVDVTMSDSCRETLPGARLSRQQLIEKYLLRDATQKFAHPLTDTPSLFAQKVSFVQESLSS